MFWKNGIFSWGSKYNSDRELAVVPIFRIALLLWLACAARSQAQQPDDVTYRFPALAFLQRDQNETPVAAVSDPAPVPTENIPFVDFADCDGRCCAPSGRCKRLFENTSFFLGLDGSKQPQDFGVNAQFGGRAAVNWAIPIVEPLGIGLQIGTAFDATANAVQVTERIQGTTGRTQSYTTVGLFQRFDNGLSWGLVYDFLEESYYDQFNLGQWRADVRYQLTDRYAIGVWSAIKSHGDAGNFGTIPVVLTPITQTNAYLTRTWNGGAQTTCWGGIANGHGQVDAALGDLPPLHNTFVFGAQIFVPLTERLALFGQANFITPVASGCVDSYLGFTYFPRGNARRSTGSRFAPLQTVAAPTNFAVDLRR